MAVNSRWRRPLYFTLLAAFCSAAQISKATVVLSVSGAGTPPEVDLPGVNAGSTSTVSDSSASLSATGSGTATFSTSISYGTPPVAYKSAQNWLTVSTPTNSITASGASVTITVKGNPTGLQAGPYSATVTFTAGSSSTKLLVTFTPQGVDLTASLPAPLSSLTAGQKAQVGKINVALTNSNGTSTTQSIQASTKTDGGNWLLTSADSAVNVTGPGVITLTVDATNLVGGSTHTATVTVQCVNGAPCLSQSIPVSVSITNPVTISANPSTLTFTAVQGSSSPKTQSFTVSASDSSNMSISTTVTSNGGPWLQAQANPTTTPSTITVTATLGSLQAGTYSGTVRVTAANGAVANVAITFNVTLAAPMFTVSDLSGNPPELDFQQVSAGLPQVQQMTIVLGVSAGTNVNFKISQPNVTWLKNISPLTGSISGSVQVPIQFTADSTGLQAQNFYSASVTISDMAGVIAPLTFPVKLPVSGVDITAALARSFSPVQIGTTAMVNVIQLQVTSTTGMGTSQAVQSMSTPAGWLSTNAESPGQYLVPTSGTGSLNVTVNAQNLTAGSYQGSITISCVNQTCLQQKLPVSVQVTNPSPTLSFITPNSGMAGSTVAVTLAGSYLTGATAINVGGGISANGLQVVNDTEITASFVIPANAAGPQSVTVTTPSGTSDALPFTVTGGQSNTVTTVLPHVAAGGSFVTGFYVVNSGSSPANFSIVFRNDAGAPISLPFTNLGSLSTLSDTIPANGAGYYEAGDPNNPNGVTGSGLVTSDPAITIQAIFRRQTSNVYYEAAVPTSAGSNEVITPFDATTFSANGAQIYTGFAIANMDSANSASLTCTARDTQGSIIPNAISVPSLNPSGHWAGYMFPALAGNRGTIDCTSNTKVGSVALRALGLDAISSLPVVSKGSGSSAVTASLPHVAAGGSFVTGFYVLNAAGIPANFSISFHDDSGAPLVLPFSSLGGLTTLSDTIPANGLAYYEAGDPSNPNGVEGSGLITADPSITIQALFRRQTSNVYYEAAVPTSPGNYEFEVPYDATTFAGNGAQIYTGFAIANLDSANAANVTCTARDAQGNVIPNAISVPSLNPSGHWANYLFPALVGNRGIINCTSNTKIGPVALRALGLDPRSRHCRSSPCAEPSPPPGSNQNSSCKRIWIWRAVSLSGRRSGNPELLFSWRPKSAWPKWGPPR